MAIATINPATGETLKTYEPLSDEALEEQDRPRRRRLGELPADDAGAAGRLAARGRRRPGRRRRHGRRADDHRDGQDARLGQGRGGQVRQGAALLRRARPGDAGAASRATPDAVGRPGGLRRLPAARRRPGDHAVELPALAGDAVRRPGADGRQRRPAQARQQRAADRALPGGAVPQGRLPRRRLPDPADRLGHDRAGAARRPGGRRDAHRQRAGRAVGGRDRRRRAEEDRARAGRQRPVHRHAVGRPGEGRRGRRHRALPEQRAELHRGQAVLRARRRRRGVHPAVRREARGADRRRPDGPRTPRSARWPPSPAARTSRSTCRTPSTRARPSSSAGKRPDGPGLVLPADAAHRDHAGDGPVLRGGLRPGRRAVHRRRASTRRSRSPTATRTGSAPTCGARTRTSGRGSSATSPPAWRSSTAW